MRNKKGITSIALTGLLGSVLPVSMAFADTGAAVPKWYDSIAISGYLQGSYVANLNDPHTFAGTKDNTVNVGRQFDTDSNGFSFNTFLLQIAKPVGDTDHYGFTVRLRAGQDAS